MREVPIKMASDASLAYHKGRESSLGSIMTITRSNYQLKWREFQGANPKDPIRVLVASSKAVAKLTENRDFSNDAANCAVTSNNSSVQQRSISMIWE